MTRNPSSLPKLATLLERLPHRLGQRPSSAALDRVPSCTGHGSVGNSEIVGSRPAGGAASGGGLARRTKGGRDTADEPVELGDIEIAASETDASGCPGRPRLIARPFALVVSVVRERFCHWQRAQAGVISGEDSRSALMLMLMIPIPVGACSLCLNLLKPVTRLIKSKVCFSPFATKTSDQRAADF
jgi:hypothetical protein